MKPEEIVEGVYANEHGSRRRVTNVDGYGVDYSDSRGRSFSVTLARFAAWAVERVERVDTPVVVRPAVYDPEHYPEDAPETEAAR